MSKEMLFNSIFSPLAKAKAENSEPSASNKEQPKLNYNDTLRYEQNTSFLNHYIDDFKEIFIKNGTSLFF
jgi:hypothetical protein